MSVLYHTRKSYTRTGKNITGNTSVSSAGIAISGEATVRLSLIKDRNLNLPVTETQERWYVNAVATFYDDALIKASKEMGRLINQAYGRDTTDTFIYLSVQGDVGINQATRPTHDDMYTLRLGVPKISHKKPLLPQP